MKRFLFFVFFLPLFAAAQSDTLGGINMAVKLNLASPIDVFNFPTLDLSLEQRIGDRVSIEGEGGYEFYRFQKPDTEFVHQTGYTTSFGFRLYHPFNWTTPIRSTLTGFYTGATFFYRREKYNAAVEFTRTGDTTTYTDYYWTDKKAWGADLILGYQRIFGGRGVFDIYGGIGMLRRNVVHHELNYSEEQGDQVTYGSKVDSFFAKKDLDEKSGPALSLSFGVRVGYIIY